MMEFDAHLARWRELRLSTAPVDRAKAESAAAELYSLSGRDPPRQFIWSRSPVELAQSWLEERSRAGRRLVGPLIGNARSVIAKELAEVSSLGVRNRLLLNDGLLRAPFSTLIVDLGLTGGGARPAALRQLLLRLRSIGAPHFSQVAHCFHSDTDLPVYTFVAGQSDGHPGLPNMRAYAELAANCEWIIPYDSICWMTDRPVVLNCDPQGRIHSADGPAIQYGDGWQTYVWKNIPVPEFAIRNSESLTLRHVDAADSSPQRRCLIEIMTPQKFIALKGASCIAEDSCGKLWLRNWRFDAWAAVEVVNGTPEPDGTFKSYFLQVPSHLRLPRQAVAWTYGLSDHEYNVIRRT